MADFDFGKEVGLIHRVIVIGRKVGADRSFWVRLSEDTEMFRRVVDLVHCVEALNPQPTVTLTEFARNYEQTLVQARKAIEQGNHVMECVNDTNFPCEGRDEEPEFVLVNFHREVDDHEDPDKSELLRELDKLGLQPEGPMELCFFGKDERTRDLQREFSIVARRQVWRDPAGNPLCPFLREVDGEYGLRLGYIGSKWGSNCLFLASHK